MVYLTFMSIMASPLAYGEPMKLQIGGVKSQLNSVKTEYY